MTDTGAACPNCGKEYWVDEADIGLIGDCEACGAEFEVRHAREPNGGTGGSSEKTTRAPADPRTQPTHIPKQEDEIARPRKKDSKNLGGS